ncbi:MAG: DUF6588 family protein [Bacteroidia bacterium]
MKKITFKISVLALIGMFSINLTFAQGDAAQFLRTGVSDGNKLMNGYLSPLMMGFASGLNNGWYQTAKAHGTGGFDITVNLGLFNVPTKYQSFDIAGLGLNTNPSGPRMVPRSGSLGTSPTIFGENKEGGTVDVVQRFTVPGVGDVDTVLTSFNLPPGLGVNSFIYLPNAQFCVGIVKKTDLIVRFIPQINNGDFKAGAFGIGIKHDFKQWIPGIADAPFDLSAIAVYNRANASYGLGENYVKPDSGVTLGVLTPDQYKTQGFDFTLNGFMVGAIISKKLGPLTPFIGVQYNNAKATLKASGVYPITFIEDDPSSPNFGEKKAVNLKDPLEITGNANGLRANIGLRFKLGPITFHGDYTLGKLNTINFGFGINIQSIAPFKL